MLLIFYLIVFPGIFFSLSKAYTEPRPLFIIGHMANCEGDVLSYLKSGANAVETDVTFESDGFPSYNYHGFPCDCLRFCFWYQKFDLYLESIRKIVNTKDDRLVMVYFDLKVSSLYDGALRNAGKLIAKMIIHHLLKGSVASSLPMIVIGVPDSSQLILLEYFEKTLKADGYGGALSRIGYDTNNPSMDAKDMLQLLYSKNITKNFFIGEGLTNCFLPSHHRIKHLIELKENSTCINNSCPENVPDGIYHWTIDGSYNQRNTLRLGVEGIMTNKPSMVLDILDEEEFQDKYRVADLNDVPWTYHNK